MMDVECTLEETLDDQLWKNSFDRLLNKRSLLRELNVIKDTVRISFNNDTSVETSENSIAVCEKVKESGSISTPNKTYGPFDCPLSPISSWRLTHFNQPDAWEASIKQKSNGLGKENRLSQKSTHISIDCCCEKREYKRQCESSHINSIPVIKLNDTNKSYEIDSIIIRHSNSQLSEHVFEDVNANVILPPGKWRRSLTVWKRINQGKCELLEHDSINYCNRSSQALTKQISFSNKENNLHIHPSIKKSQVALLKICEQSTILPFSNIYSDTTLRKCRKIGEGTYGEVFLNSSENEESVLKIIPIQGDIFVNGEPQKSFTQILPEVIITNALSKLRQKKSHRTSGFVFLKNVRCVKGKYPNHLIELWNLYEKNYGSENDHPRMFKENQLYVALEIAYGGKDLEKFIFQNAEQAYATFLQVTFSLAVAEKSMQFEHRDLHCGNILIQPTNEKNIEYVVNNNKIKISTKGVKVTIIDYTLSRMFFDKCHYYNDLSGDDELFSAKGDYQYDIYRLMRTKLRNNWKSYEPQTNVMWLHYVLTKLICGVKYKNSKSKQHMIYIERMETIQNTLMNYNSAFEVSIRIHT